MSWVLDDAPDALHEGFPAYVTADGTAAVATDRRGLILKFDDHDEHRDQVAPWAALFGWEARCSCGWVGPMYRRTAPDDQDAADHDTGPDADHATAEDAIFAAWLAHAHKRAASSDWLARIRRTEARS